jgi:hypothetical protein
MPGVCCGLCRHRLDNRRREALRTSSPCLCLASEPEPEPEPESTSPNSCRLLYSNLSMHRLIGARSSGPVEVVMPVR